MNGGVPGSEQLQKCRSEQQGASPGCSGGSPSSSCALNEEQSEDLLQDSGLNSEFFPRVGISPSFLEAIPEADLRHPRGGYYITMEIVCVVYVKTLNLTAASLPYTLGKFFPSISRLNTWYLIISQGWQNKHNGGDVCSDLFLCVCVRVNFWQHQCLQEADKTFLLKSHGQPGIAACQQISAY